jgi:hypothetical protein
MNEQKSGGPTDAAALAGSAVAATIGLAVGDGPYGVLGLVMSASLLLIIFGYIWPHTRPPLQSWAAASAIAVAAIPGVGFGLEIILCRLGTAVGKDGSRVCGVYVAVAWVVLTCICAIWDRMVQRMKKA